MTFRQSVKKIIKISSIISSVMFAFLVVFGILVFFDTQSFNKGFETEEKIFILDDNGFTAGLKVIDFDDESTIEYLTDKDLAQLESLYTNIEYKQMLKNSWRLFVIESSFLTGSDSIQISPTQTLTNEQAIQVLRSDNPNLVFYRAFYPDVQESQIDKIPDNELKANIFIQMFGDTMSKSPVNFYMGYKNKKIIIYPETIMFTVVKLAPEKYINKMAPVGEKG